MPLLAASRRAAVRWTAAIGLAALVAAPATAGAASTEPPRGCPDTPTVQPFAHWQDLADYVLAPDGDIEDGAATWSLTGDAAAVEGNEPFGVGAPGDHLALSIPGGATATTAPMCVGLEHKTVRLLAKGSGALRVDAIYTRADGEEQVKTIGAVGASADWAPSNILAVKVNRLADDYDNAMQVAFRFTANTGSDWTIDAVYVDPFRVR